MGFFKALAEQNFKKDSQGNTLYYPWGSFASGVIIDSEKTKNQIQRFIKKSFLIAIIVVVFFQILKNWAGIILILSIFPWYYLGIKKRIQNLPKSTEKIKISESIENSTKFLNLPTLILFELLCCAAVVAGIWIAMDGRELITAYSGIIFFGLCAVCYGYMIKIKLNKQGY
jgi:hypothetical protein